MKQNRQFNPASIPAPPDRLPRLLLHSCCGPCSTAVLECLLPCFDVDILYFNPNIRPREEYERRVKAQRDVLEKMPLPRPVGLIVCDYEPDVFSDAARGLEEEPEGGARCRVCFRLRLEETARRAKEMGYDAFATTLSVSPHKNAKVLNEVGAEAARIFGVPFLEADFKKNEGYKRSTELSRELELYRQPYCGCRPG
jgi:predicted adenine nucleotide alpha hydrolase (AANH) superfamily ATPase